MDCLSFIFQAKFTSQPCCLPDPWAYLCEMRNRGRSIRGWGFVALYTWSLLLTLLHGAQHGFLLVAETGHEGKGHHVCAHHPAPVSRELPVDADRWNPEDCEVCEVLRQALDGEWPRSEHVQGWDGPMVPHSCFYAQVPRGRWGEGLADRGPPSSAYPHA